MRTWSASKMEPAMINCDDAINFESWTTFSYVVAAARSGSFLAASKRLGTNQSTIGWHAQRLEKRLGAVVWIVIRMACA